MTESAELAAARARLAELDREQEGLQAEHDLAMSRFLFDEANALQRRIAPLDEERRAILARLPEPALPPEPPPAPVTPGVRLRAPMRGGRRGRRLR